MAEEHLADLLTENPWFKALEPHHFQKLVSIAGEFHWAESQTIFSEGDRDNYLFLIVEGRVALDNYLPGQGRVTILTLGPDEIFGWSAVIPVVGTRTAGARAVTDVRVVAFDSKALRQACDEDHDLGYIVYRRLTNVIAGRLTATRLQLIDMYAGAKK